MKHWLLVGLLAALGLLAGLTGPTAFDVSALQWVSTARTPLLSDLFVIVTTFGLTPVALMVSLLVWLRNRAAGIQMFVVTAGAWCMVELLKPVIERPRPPFPSRLVDTYGFSFPSGHTMVATATYTTLAIILYRDCRSPLHRSLAMIGAVVTIGIVAFSRIYLGVHYVSDAIGGILLGTAWAFSVGSSLGIRTLARFRSPHQQH